jgi:hypothetical protein
LPFGLTVEQTFDRALRAMYDTCAFHGCDTAFTRCEIHHLTDWLHGGTTDLAHMIPLCAHHHHVIHDDGWQLELAPDRTLTIRQPDGQTHAVCHPPTRRRTRRRTDHQNAGPTLAA